MNKIYALLRTKPKSPAHVAAFRSVVALLLTVSMYSLIHVLGVAKTITATFPNMDHSGDTFATIWCGLFLAWRLTKAWGPVWRGREEGKQ